MGFNSEFKGLTQWNLMKEEEEDKNSKKEKNGV